MAKWKTIDEFPDYLVSDDGKVKSRRHRRSQDDILLSPGKDRGGHPKVILYDETGNRYTRLVHRLMAKAFLPNPKNKPLVRHLNDIPDDNRIENLSWGNKSENAYDAIKNGRTNNTSKKPVIVIKNDEKIYFDSYISASHGLNASVGTIRRRVMNNEKYNDYNIYNYNPRHFGKRKKDKDV